MYSLSCWIMRLSSLESCAYGTRWFHLRLGKNGGKWITSLSTLPYPFQMTDIWRCHWTGTKSIQRSWWTTWHMARKRAGALVNCYNSINAWNTLLQIIGKSGQSTLQLIKCMGSEKKLDRSALPLNKLHSNKGTNKMSHNMQWPSMFNLHKLCFNHKYIINSCSTSSSSSTFIYKFKFKKQ